MKISRIGYSFNYNSINKFNGIQPSLKPQPEQRKDIPDNHKYEIPFTGYECSPSKFRIKQAYRIECPCCGQVMVTRKQLNAFASRVDGKRGEALQNELKKYYEYYRPNEEEIVSILISASKAKPDADISELVRDAGEKALASLELEQKDIFERIRRKAEFLQPETKEKVNKVLDESTEILEHSDEEKSFKNKPIISRIYEIKENCPKRDKNKMDAIFELICKLPSSNTSKNAFFVKYSRRSNSEIAARLVLPALTTTEHITPQSKQGNDNTDNYIPLCGSCNSTRGTMPYNEWFMCHPEMPENLQNYIDKIHVMIKNNEFQGSEYYDSYVEEIIEAVKRATDGKLVLKAPVDDEPLAPADTSESEEISKEKTIDEVRSEWLEEYERLIKYTDSLQAQYDELSKDEEYLNIVKYQNLAVKLAALKTAKGAKQKEYNAARRKEKIAIKNSEGAESPKEQQTAESKLNAASSTCTELREKLRGMSEEISNLEKESAALLTKISLPSDIHTEILSLKSSIHRIQSLTNEINELNEIISDEDDLVIYLVSVRSRINIINERISKNGQSLDFSSPENMQKAEQYLLVKKQLSMLDSINPEEFKKLIGTKDDIDPSFIIEEARKSVLARMDALKEDPYVAYLRDTDKVQELEEESAKVAQELETIKDARKLLGKKRFDLYAESDGQSLKELEDKIAQLNTRLTEVQQKFSNVDLAERITALRTRAKDIIQKYSESFEVSPY